MPCGSVRSGDFRNGTPMILTHQFGTPVNNPEPFGNVVPQSNATLDSNPVTWAPSPAYFGNMTGLSLQSVPPIVVTAQTTTPNVTIVLTKLGGFTGNATLTYSGAPSGVTVAFSPNPDTGESTATITVGSVPLGFYTITVTGTSGNEIEYTNIHLVVASGSPPSADYLVQEDGTSTFLLEDGSGSILLEN